MAGTGELGFFNRGARAEIGTFPGKELNNPLATCVVDICPVGALTSTRFRFAERVWYLDKKPSICTGCEVGCNITMEHRRGDIKRYKPRFNVEVNDYWMCDYGRSTFERYKTDAAADHAARARRRRERQWAAPLAASWKEALDAVHRRLQARRDGRRSPFLGSAFLTCEEAYLVRQAGRRASARPTARCRSTLGPAWTIPQPQAAADHRPRGGAQPPRRGARRARRRATARR